MKNKTKKTIAKTTIIYSTVNAVYNMIEYHRVTVGGYLYSYRSASTLLTRLGIEHIDIDQLERFALDNR